MGSGVSSTNSGFYNARKTAIFMIQGKPLDASDINDLETARQEISKYRHMVKDILGDSMKNHLDPTKEVEFDKKAEKMVPKRAAVMDKRDDEGEIDTEYIPKVVPKSNKVKEQLLHVVEKNILFASYTKEEHMAIIDAFESVTYKANDIVIRQGEQGHNFFIVESGYLDIFVNKGSDGIGNKVGMQLGPQTSFGELALMYNTPRAASIKANTDCALWTIERSVYRSVLIHYKSVRNQMYMELIKNVEVVGKRLGSCLHKNDIVKLAATMDRETFPPGEVIIRQGNKGNHFYIIVEGEVNVYKTKKMSNQGNYENNDTFEGNENEEFLATLKTGQFFGEKALLKEDVRQASCVSKTEVICLTLGRDDFIDMVGTIDEKALVGLSMKNIASEKKSEYPPVSMASPHSARSESKSDDHTKDSMKGSASTSALVKAQHVDSDKAKYVLSNFTLKRIIGRGAFGHVKIAYCQAGPASAKEFFAIKCQLKKAIVENDLKKHVLNEISLMKKANHPFINKLYAATQDDHFLYFFLELLPGGELFSYLQSVGKISENDAKFYSGAVVSAFIHLHQTNLRIAYRDLKPENIVLTSKGYPKLVDFGLAKQLPAGTKTWTMCGTPDYLSPEIILNQGHDIAVDYWCLGILITEMVSGHTPFEGDSPMQIYEKILNSQPRLPSYFGKPMSDLILKLLRIEPGKRIGNTKDGIAAIVSHKWYGNFNWKKLETEQMVAPYVPKMKAPDDMSNFEEYDDEPTPNEAPCPWTPDLD